MITRLWCRLRRRHDVACHITVTGEVLCICNNCHAQLTYKRGMYISTHR